MALARALAAQPRVLLLDEPFSALDTDLRTARHDLLQEVRAILRPTVVMVTHDIGEASIADTVAVLDRGRLAQSGSLDQLYAAPASTTVARLLGGFTEVPGRLTDRGIRSPVGWRRIGPPRAAGAGHGAGAPRGCHPDRARQHRRVGHRCGGAHHAHRTPLGRPRHAQPIRACCLRPRAHRRQGRAAGRGAPGGRGPGRSEGDRSRGVPAHGGRSGVAAPTAQEAASSMVRSPPGFLADVSSASRVVTRTSRVRARCTGHLSAIASSACR